MRCNDFDAHIDEMLSGILHPDANQHMRQCERCTSHFRARAAVQDSLRKLASVSANGPSLATDRAVMESYRRLQQRRTTNECVPDSAASVARGQVRMLTFPSHSLTSTWTSRTWWSSAAAAAIVFAVLGSAAHLWHGVPAVSAPAVAEAPAAPAVPQSASAKEPIPGVAEIAKTMASAASRHLSQRPSQLSPVANSTAAAPSGLPTQPVLAAKAPVRGPVLDGASYAANYDSTPVTEFPAGTAPVIRLASIGTANSLAQSASSTWPGYSNLMYCDPVVCSGPMQVVHIKVPVRQVKPNLGQTVGNSFVNAEVVVGPDGVARAIRVAN